MADAYQPLEREVTVLNRDGLHARPVMKFVELAQKFSASIRVTAAGQNSDVVDGKSAMELMLLGAPFDTRLRIRATGPDAENALEELVALVERQFDMDPS